MLAEVRTITASALRCLAKNRSLMLSRAAAFPVGERCRGGGVPHSHSSPSSSLQTASVRTSTFRVAGHHQHYGRPTVPRQMGILRQYLSPTVPALLSRHGWNPNRATTTGFGPDLTSGADVARRHWAEEEEAVRKVPLGHQRIHPALQLIVDRARSGSEPGTRSDAFKLGLVVEGGGMRGSVTAGMLAALHDLGLQRVFDSVYGSSAGAINLTYFLTGQREGVDIYADMLSNRDFIDLSRLFMRSAGPVLDLSFLLDKVMKEDVPLQWERVLSHDIPLKAVASCVRTLQPVLLDQFLDATDLLTCLRASANVPGIAGSPINHRGHSLVDAAVFEPVPFPAAVADGCTHVLVLCSRPDPTRLRIGPLRGRLNRALAEVVRKAVLSPSYMKPAWETRLVHDSQVGMTIDEILFMSMDEAGPAPPLCDDSFVFPLFPGPAASFAPLCTDADTIRAGVREGSDTVHRAFQHLL
uniref:Patatin n=1 Tax=Tetraselmis chuii TaxID=63592 RepID=A0A7S1SUM6_9CHLO|mmetsp:Transcript_304/g.529  ORF Transcript_304/g.529 Transcript_304/m.529 type:complete len:469 (+) Transcript_304:205-1611(+)